MTSSVPPTASGPQQKRLAVALDLSVLDQLLGIDEGRYKGSRDGALRRVRAAGESRRMEVWIPEITPVEMLHGIEKIAADGAKKAEAEARDQAKLAIARAMGARTLAYPCSKIGDTYSRIGISFRIGGPDSERADALERRLLSVKRVSEGDARQLVSCAFPTDGENVDFHPKLDWFVAEEGSLVKALKRRWQQGSCQRSGTFRLGLRKTLLKPTPWSSSGDALNNSSESDLICWGAGRRTTGEQPGGRI